MSQDLILIKADFFFDFRSHLVHLTSLVLFSFLIALWTTNSQVRILFSIHLLIREFLLRYSVLEVGFEAIWWFTRQNIDSSCCDILPFGSNEWWNWTVCIFGTICKFDTSHWFKMASRQKLTWFFNFHHRSSLWYWQQMQLWVWLLKQMLKKLLRFLLLNKPLMLCLILRVPAVWLVLFWYMLRYSLVNDIDLWLNLCALMYLYTIRNRALLDIGGGRRWFKPYCFYATWGVFSLLYCLSNHITFSVCFKHLGTPNSWS